MKTLPTGVVAYRRTRDFTEDTVPDALRHAHATKAGVWGRIRVEAGTLRYRILGPEPEEHVLTPTQVGVIEPAVPHAVEPIGDGVRFFVEFLR